MIIKDVRLTRGTDATTLSARCKIRKLGWDTMYFSVDPQKSDYLTVDASPFAAALLLPAMSQGEDLIIKGSLPRQVYEAMHTVMRDSIAWDDDSFQPIAIQVDTLTEEALTPHKTASFFTGGVDSFYTYLKHKTDRTNNRVDSFILARGFDIHPKDQTLWDVTLKNMQAIAREEGIELVTVETNLHELLLPVISWEYNHGNCLAAIGLLLRQEYHLLYIPSSFTEPEQQAFEDQKLFIGSALKLDKLWSTEHTTFVHDGAEATRLNKVLWQVAKSPVALKHLRVCYENPKGIYNCGECDKCLRTMVNLYIAGALDKAATFPHSIDTDKLAATPSAAIFGVGFHNENLAALRERNLNPSLQAAITASLSKAASMGVSRFDTFKQAVYHKPLHKLIYLDYIYGFSIMYGILSRLFGRRFF